MPVHKKNEKNLKETTVLFLCYQFLGKYLKNSYTILHNLTLMNHMNCSTQINHLEDSKANQLLSITHPIFKAFDFNPPLDVRSVYYDISEAFDSVWHDGLIYELKRCGVSG